MIIDRPDLRDRLAAEYVLGTLRGHARSRFEKQLAASVTLTQAVREWEDRLLPMAQTVAPVAPPAQVWSGIEARLFNTGSAAQGARAAAAGVAPGAAPGPVAAAVAWWQQLWLWRGATALATVAAVSLGIALLKLEQAPPAPAQVAVLQDDAGKPTLLIRVSAEPARPGFADVRALEATPLTPNKSYELWAIPAGGAPRSLGVLPSTGAGKLNVTQSQLDHADVLAITLEPLGGSPSGKPTGPVVSKGHIHTL